jgi:hypothetical protein
VANIASVPTRVENEPCSDDEIFSEVLRETVTLIERAGIPYVLIGGLASTGHGRARWTHDIDFLVRPEDADRTLRALQAAGYRTEKPDPRWLYKAFSRDVIIDIIFRSTGEIRLDPEMLQRSVQLELFGVRARFAPPEDLLVMKVLVHDEDGTRHWHDALGLIAGNELDWDYLLRRAHRAPRRVLSLLIYAHSRDLHVPNRVIRALYNEIYGDAS